MGVVGVTAAEEKKVESIKDVMKKFHSAPKGEQKMCEKFVAGKTTEAENKDILSAMKHSASSSRQRAMRPCGRKRP